MSDQFERQVFTYEQERRAAERAHDTHQENFRLLNETATRDAQGAIKILLVINGGAAVALLAFCGTLVGKSDSLRNKIPEVISNLNWFGIGVICIALAAIFAYLANSCYAGAGSTVMLSWNAPFISDTPIAKRWKVAAIIFHGLGIVAALLSLFMFIWGLFEVQYAVRNLI